MFKRLMPSLLLCFFCAQSFAEVVNTGVVAERGNIKLTLEEMDVIMENVPTADRPAFLAGSDRMQHMLDTELLNKQLAQRGRELKLTESPMTQQLLARAAEQELAKITLSQIIKDAKRPDFALMAKEYYTVNSAEFSTSVTSVVQHILIAKTGKTPMEVLARAQLVFKKAQAPGADFDALVKDYSDDPSKSDNQGVMTVAEPGQFVPTFEAAAHALKAVGDISQVETEFGTHVLRLKSRVPGERKAFESVREEIIAKLSAEFEEGVRTKLFSDLRSANPVFNEAGIEALKKRYGEVPKLGAEPLAPLPTPPTSPALDAIK